MTIEEPARMTNEGVNNTATKEDMKGVEKRLTARLNRIENLILKDYGQRIETLEKQVKKLAV
jgi:hypothetical protein